MKILAFVAVIAAAFVATAYAAEYLETVESPVFTKPGTHQQIAAAGRTCIAQIVKPGMVNAPVIVSADMDSGVVVANNAFEFSHGFLLPMPYRARTTLTFQAKDGRFRITNTSIEAFFDAQGWRPVGLWSGAGADKAKAAIDGISATIAKCVVSGGTSSDW